MVAPAALNLVTVAEAEGESEIVSKLEVVAAAEEIEDALEYEHVSQLEVDAAAGEI